MSENKKQTKQIIWVHGNKGGIGKSLMAAVVIDYLLGKGEQVALVESDGSVPDVQRRYGDTLPSIIAPLVDAESVDQILESLETLGETEIRTVVVNLPANAELIDSIADEVKDVCQALDFESRTLFMIDNCEDSAKLAEKSANSGIASISSKCCAVINMRFGKTESNFKWFEDGMPYRSNFLKPTKNNETALPMLKSRITTHTDFKNHPLSSLAAPQSPFRVVDRVGLQRWLIDAHNIVEELLK